MHQHEQHDAGSAQEVHGARRLATAEEVERARKLMGAFRESEALGRGAVEFRGMMLDYANLRWAKRILGLDSEV